MGILMQFTGQQQAPVTFVSPITGQAYRVKGGQSVLVDDRDVPWLERLPFRRIVATSAAKPDLAEVAPLTAELAGFAQPPAAPTAQEAVEQQPLRRGRGRPRKEKG